MMEQQRKKSVIIPFKDSSHSMQPWPDLAFMGRRIHIQGERETLFFFDSGRGFSSLSRKGTIVLVHGLGDEADSWRRILPPLASAGLRVLAPDLPGFGRSAAPGRINLARHGEAVLRLLEAADVSPARPAVLAGSSMGGAVIQEAARKRPDLVKALIFIDGGIPLKVGGRLALAVNALPIIGPRWYRAFRNDHERAYRSLFGFYQDLGGLPQRDRDFLRQRVIARVESPGQERAYFASLRSMIWALIIRKSGLRRFPGPVLFIWGEKDALFPPASASPLRKQRPEAPFVMIAGAGHLPHQEKPGETAKAIVDFLWGR